jgi:ribonuclease VapC
MVVETSAFVAILQDEPSRAALLAKIVQAPHKIMSAPSVLEAHMVLKKTHGEKTASLIRENLEDFAIEVVAFTAEHAAEATRAFDRFGKGRHPAGLNFGDCVAYALAQVSGQALLFVGDDFARTDVRTA